MSYSKASFLSAEELEKAKAALSKGAEHIPEVALQRPNLAAMVSEEAIRNFWATAKKVEVGSSSAKQSEGISREHSELFAAIKSHDGLVAKMPLVRKVNWALVSWGQIVTKEISDLTAPLRRDQYIGSHLNHLKTEGHRITKEEESYEITKEDLVRVEEAMSLAGNRLLYTAGLREKAKAVASERNAQKDDLRQHQTKMPIVLEGLQSYFEKRQELKISYAEHYEGGVWDRAIIMAYAKDESLTLSELKKMGKWLQSDEVVYAIEDAPDLDQWMTAWRPYLKSLEDEKNIYAKDKDHRQFLDTLDSMQSLEEPYMVVLLKLAALKKETLKEKVEKVHKELLPAEYLKTLMTRKNQVTIELKKRLEKKETLAEQLLRPVELYPHFVMAGASSDVTDLSQSTINLGKSGLMDSIVFDASAVKGIIASSDDVGSSSDSSSKAVSYQMEMDPSNTYVYDSETRKYIKATSGTGLPGLFLNMEKAVDKGYFYNAYATTLIVLGDSSGYVNVNESGETGRGFHIMQKTVTPFSEVKKGSVQINSQVE